MIWSTVTVCGNINRVATNLEFFVHHSSNSVKLLFWTSNQESCALLTWPECWNLYVMTLVKGHYYNYFVTIPMEKPGNSTPILWPP